MCYFVDAIVWQIPIPILLWSPLKHEFTLLKTQDLTKFTINTQVYLIAMGSFIIYSYFTSFRLGSGLQMSSHLISLRWWLISLPKPFWGHPHQTHMHKSCFSGARIHYVKNSWFLCECPPPPKKQKTESACSVFINSSGIMLFEMTATLG